LTRHQANPLSLGSLNHTPGATSNGWDECLEGPSALGGTGDWRKHQLPLLKGGCLIPCDGNKTPIAGKGWQDKGYTADQIAVMDDAQAVGINAAKTDLVCIDIDGPKALTFYREHHLPLPTTWVVGRTTDTTRTKHIYRVTPEQEARLPKDTGKRSWKDHQLEAFWNSQQFIVAGNHPSGGQYTWTGGASNIANLPEAWTHFLLNGTASQPPLSNASEAQHQRDTSLSLLGDREIRLQDLLTRDHSHLVEAGLQEGNRNNGLFAFAADAYTAETEARRLGTRLDTTADDLIHSILRSARKGGSLAHGFDKRWSYATRHQQRQSDQTTPQGHSLPPGAIRGLKTSPFQDLVNLLPCGTNPQTGKPATTQAGNIAGMFSLYLPGRLAFNELSGFIELDGKPLSESRRKQLLCAIQRHGWRISDQTLIEAIQAVSAENSYHPVEQYLTSNSAEPLPMEQWQRLDQHLLGLDDPLAAKFLPRYLISAVARILQPGASIRQTPVLVGP